MTIRLRPHHLLCILTFVGEGYTPAFVANFERLMIRIASGNETIEVVQGPDDLCSPLLGETGCHCHNPSVTLRDQLAADAISALLQQPLLPQTRLALTHDVLSRLRTAFIEETIRQACIGCPWKPICDTIAQSGLPPTQPFVR